MKSNYPFITFFFILSVLFNSCDDSGEKNFTIVQTQSPFDFHAIVEFEDKLYATGGDVWNKSYMLVSNDGVSWSMDSLTNKSVFDLYANETTLYGVGNDGYIFSGNPDLKLTRTKFWGLLRAFASTDKTFVAVGGKDFNKGWIYQVNEELKVDTAHNFQHELADVWCNEQGNCIACGYGIILTSDDRGASWMRNNETGDYYNSIFVNDTGIIYIVGYSGSIIKSNDLGRSWEKLKNGHSPLSDNKPFRAIKFKEEVGVICGDNGLIWISYDGGQKWKDISIDTELDLFDFEFFDDDLIAVSEQGQIIRIDMN